MAGDAEQFSEDLRRRTRLGVALGVSGAAGLLLSLVGAVAASRATVALAGRAWLATSYSLYRLQSDGWVAPSASISFLGYGPEDRQAAAPLVFVLWAIGAFIAAYSMK